MFPTYVFLMFWKCFENGTLFALLQMCLNTFHILQQSVILFRRYPSHDAPELAIPSRQKDQVVMFPPWRIRQKRPIRKHPPPKKPGGGVVWRPPQAKVWSLLPQTKVPPPQKKRGIGKEDVVGMPRNVNRMLSSLFSERPIVISSIICQFLKCYFSLRSYFWRPIPHHE